MVALSVAAPVIVLGDFASEDPWTVVGVGLLAAAIGIAVEEWVSRRVQVRTEDEAVAQVIQGGKAVETDVGMSSRLTVDPPSSGHL